MREITGDISRHPCCDLLSASASCLEFHSSRNQPIYFPFKSVVDLRILELGFEEGVLTREREIKKRKARQGQVTKKRAQRKQGKRASEAEQRESAAQDVVL